MSKTFKIRIEDNRPEAEDMKKAWGKASDKSVEDSTIFHEFTATDVEDEKEALKEVLNLLGPESKNMKITSISEEPPKELADEVEKDG